MFEQALGKYFKLFFVILLLCPIGTLQNIVGKKKGNLVAKQSKLPVHAQSIMRGVKSHIMSLPKRTKTRASKELNLTPEQFQKFKIWEKGEIPFYIDAYSFQDMSLRDKIRWFLNEVSSMTKLNFIELPSPPVDYNDTRWVYFINRRSQLGCYDISYADMTLQGMQHVVLGYDCLESGGGLAEIVLAIAGIPPQHNAPNRDEYIEVIEGNIIPGYLVGLCVLQSDCLQSWVYVHLQPAKKLHLFKKLDPNDWLFDDMPYDFDSASHFHEHKHSVGRGATIKLKDQGIAQIGFQTGFSETDISKINKLYNYIVQNSQPYGQMCSKLFDNPVTN